MRKSNYLINDMLLNDDILDICYDYCYEPDVVGIATEEMDNKRKYFVYNTNERGRIDWVEEKNTFDEALLFARIMHKGMIKAYQRFDNNETNIKIHEEIIQEIFRQLLIRNNIASDYFIVHEDDFEFKKDEYGPFGGAVYIFKDNDNIWNVWEDVDFEVFMGYYKGRHVDLKQFDSQEEAYIDAAKRRGLIISKQDLTYDVNDSKIMLNTIESAKNFLKIVIDFPFPRNVDKLIQRYSLLEFLEKIILKQNNNAYEGSTKKKIRKSNYLINDMLFNDDILDICYDYCYEPDVVGIVINNKGDKRQYLVYVTDERGNIDLIKEKNTFDEALSYAREMYIGLKAYYRGIINDCAKIKSRTLNK